MVETWRTFLTIARHNQVNHERCLVEVRDDGRLRAIREDGTWCFIRGTMDDFEKFIAKDDA